MEGCGRTVSQSPLNVIDELLGCPPALLETTFDQLRTLLVVHEAGTALRAARALGREQSSVQKQLDTLNRNCQTVCGEVLVVKQGRGKDLLFTPTGADAVDQARKTLSAWAGGIHRARRRLGSMLTVGTTEFTLPIVSRARDRLAEEFQRREVEFRVLHVRTKDLWSRLEGKEVDLVCGSVVRVPGDGARLKDFDVIEFSRGDPMLLTNLPEADLPGGVVTTSRLAALPLAVPSAGIVADLLSTWYGPAYRNRLSIVADIDDIYYGLSILRSGLVQGCMITTRSLADRMATGGPGDHPLRVVGLRDDLDSRAEIMTGAFVRTEDRKSYDSGHPLNRLWETMRDSRG